MAITEVYERDEYGRPIHFLDILDEQTEKAYRMLPIAKPIMVEVEKNKCHKKLYYCRDCGSWVRKYQSICVHCFTRQDWRDKK